MSDDYDYDAYQKKKQEQRKRDQEFWPKGSLERVLGQIGARSLSEAVSKVRNQEQIQTPSEIPLKEESPVDNSVESVYRAAVAELEILSKNFDYSSIPPETKRSLDNMPLNSIEEVATWKNAWKEILTPYVW